VEDQIPETRYAAVGDADVAYQVVGDGPLDLLNFFGLGTHLELVWGLTWPAWFIRRLTSFARLIIFNRRGTGASDALPRNAIATWEECTEDLLAVLDAAGSQHAVILAAIDAGPTAIMFAAAHPERVSALVLMTTAARYLVADDYPAGVSPEAVDAVVKMIEAHWGTASFLQIVSPSLANDARTLDAIARMHRSSATPRAAAAQLDYIMRSVDVRHVLPLIGVPTLVLHVAENPMLPIEHGLYLAEHIKGAKFVALPGGDVVVTEENAVAADEIAEFLTGHRPPVEIDRILTTVLFSDIVESTKNAAALGDQRWRSLLDRHDRVVRDALVRFRGREINTTGDGFVASFDGPARAIRCARAIVDATRGLGVDVRVGLHTGECEVRGDDLGGLAVHIAARVGAVARPGEVLVSGTVKDLVAGSGIDFYDRGESELRGVPGAWRLFAVEG
jgi:class 3 adenylate cyclase